MAQKKSAGGEKLLDSLRSSPETKRLTEEARHLLQAGSGRLTSKLGDGVTGAAQKLTDIGDSGSLSLGEGAKRMLGGEGPLKAGLGAATAGVTDKVKGVFGKGSKGGKGGSKTKAMNIEESIDIGVPVSVAYDQWTQFQDFSRFMKGVESVEQTDDTELTWRGKVFKSRRTWKAKIQEQVPDRRIVWTSEGGKGSTKGVVTFHPLADDLTRVLLALEYYPSGVVEKTGNLWRAAGRRARLDLKNFRRFVMMENEPTGSWRGEIQEGEVVKGPDEADDDNEAEDNENEAEDNENEAEDSSEQSQGDEEQSRDRDEEQRRGRDGEQSRRRRRPAAKAEPQKRDRRRPPAKKSGDSGERPRKQARKSSSSNGETRKSTPAKKSSSSSSSARKQSGSSSGSARKQSGSSSGSARKQSGSSSSSARKQSGSSSSRTPRKQSGSSSSSARKQSDSSSSRTPRKQSGSRAPAKKQASKRAPAKKSTSSSRSPRKQASKRTTARKRTSR
jgi:uncharacterized membrane protein